MTSKIFACVTNTVKMASVAMCTLQKKERNNGQYYNYAVYLPKFLIDQLGLPAGLIMKCEHDPKENNKITLSWTEQ